MYVCLRFYGRIDIRFVVGGQYKILTMHND